MEVMNDTQSNQSMAAVPLNVKAIAELLPIAAVIVTVNIVVFVVFLKTKKLRTSANYILFSLAVSDFMTGALNIPLFAIVVFTPIISSNTVRFYMGFLVTSVHTVTAILSVYHILFATLDIYLSIIWPVIHRLIKTATVRKVILVVWFVSAVVGFAPFTWINQIHSPSGAKYFQVYIIACFVMVFALPYSFMIYAFIKVFQAITRRLKERKKPRSYRKRKLASDKKCIVLFVTMAALFAVCWFPWFALMLLYTLNFSLQSLDTPAHVFTLVRYITSVINPFLYSLLRPDFNTGLKKLFKLENYFVSTTGSSRESRGGSSQPAGRGSNR